MIEQWKPTTRGGHHVRNAKPMTVKRFAGWSGEVCLRTGGPASEDPKDWQMQVWFEDGSYYGHQGPQSDLDLVAINEGETAMDWKERIKQWAADRNLIEGSTAFKQVRKLIEETEELAFALHENNFEETKDAIGDIQVVLAVMCCQLGIDIDECREIAYEQIKNRKGRMVDGVFVKEVQSD
jgi:NTP pyrophosphatase (non-canonical NTP hydrolase)